VNSIRGNNSTELAAVWTEVERRLTHLVAEERQLLIPVLNEYLNLLCNDIEGVPPCTTKGHHAIWTGEAPLLKRILTEYRMR